MLNFLTNPNIDYVSKAPDCYPFFNAPFSVGAWLSANSLITPASQSEGMEDFLEINGSVLGEVSPEKYMEYIKSESPEKFDSDSLKFTDPERRLIKKTETNRIFQTEEVLMISPLSYESSVIYGYGTKWCTSSNATKKYYNTYASRASIFILMLKDAPEPYKKVLLILFPNNLFCLFDSLCCVINNGKVFDENSNVIAENKLAEIEDFFSPELIDSIYNDHSLHV